MFLNTKNPCKQFRKLRFASIFWPRCRNTKFWYNIFRAIFPDSHEDLLTECVPNNSGHFGSLTVTKWERYNKKDATQNHEITIHIWLAIELCKQNAPYIRKRKVTSRKVKFRLKWGRDIHFFCFWYFEASINGFVIRRVNHALNAEVLLWFRGSSTLC